MIYTKIREPGKLNHTKRKVVLQDLIIPNLTLVVPLRLLYIKFLAH